MREFLERRGRSSAEAVDRLVGISDREKILFGPGQKLRQFDLRQVDVLELVEQQEARAALLGCPQRFVILQQFQRARDHVGEGAEVFLREHLLDLLECAGDLVAARQHFVARHALGLLRAYDARQ